MQPAIDRSKRETEVSRRLSDFASGLAYEDIPADVRYSARQCLLDWLGVTIAGSQEPLTQHLFDVARAGGLGEQATLIGLGHRGSPAQAALINGSAGHALDYDDVLRIFGGHATAPVAPAVLALAERDRRSGRDLLTAFVAGVELASRVGGFVGDCRLNGFHQTGVVGTLGAAAGTARLLGLDGEKTATALGIAATQASALVASFGTMCKPLHGGKAAESGLLAAELAARGFTGRPDILECEGGFAEVFGTDFNTELALDGLGKVFHLPNTLFKYHAACYGTHAGLESAHAARRNPAFSLDKVEKVELNVPIKTMRICNIWEPKTGLETKFSHRLTVALALTGENTGGLTTFSAESAARPDLVSLRDKVTVNPHENYGPNQTDITVYQSDGTVIREMRDMAVPNRDLDDQWDKLEGKFRALVEPIVGAANTDAAVAAIRDLESLDKLEALSRACIGKG